MAESDLFPTILPSAMEGTTLGSATVATYPTKDATTERDYIPFDDTTVEGVLLNLGQMPRRFNSLLTTKARFVVSIDDDDTDDPVIVLLVGVEAITPSSDNLDMHSTSSFDTENEGTALVPATARDPFILDVTLTNIDDAAIGDELRLTVCRGGASDTGVGDLWVHSMDIWQEL